MGRSGRGRGRQGGANSARHNGGMFASNNRHGRGGGSSNVNASRSMATEADLPRVSTPPLAEAVPEDTPTFADFVGQNIVDPVILDTITRDLKFNHMMPVQAATLKELLPPKRSDCLVQAKTGTGKTVAFLLPAIQTMINKGRSRGTNPISILVISPTRELALQIAKEADKLLQNKPEYSGRVCTAIGGTNKNMEEKRILGRCSILVATPGRLFDHMSNPAVKDAFQSLDTLVLDEADRLLDMGFLDALKDIVKCLPDKTSTDRQGMLFSATIAPHVQQVAHLVLSEDYKFITTIPPGEANVHESVPQHLITVDNFSLVAPALVGSIREEAARVGPDNFKAIVFAPTAGQANFYGDVLKNVAGLRCGASVLHSRMSQSARGKVNDSFRQAKSGIVVATDVIARGMDFPGVTTVFQVGIPSNKEAYIHRLGRTARAGAEGRGIFILSKEESFFARRDLREIEFVPTAADVSAADKVEAVATNMTVEARTKVYQAWLGYYKTYLKALGWEKEDLVKQANLFARNSLGATETPSLQKSTVGKMGMRGVKGLVVVPDLPRQPRNRGPAQKEEMM